MRHVDQRAAEGDRRRRNEHREVAAPIYLDLLRARCQRQHGRALAAEETPDWAHRADVRLLLLMPEGHEPVGEAVEIADERNTPHGVVGERLERPFKPQLDRHAE